MEIFQESVRNARNLRAEARMHPQQEIDEVVVNLSEKTGFSVDVLSKNSDLFCILVRSAGLRVNPPGSKRPPRSLMAVCGFGEVFLVAGDLLDAGSEILRLEGELVTARKDLERSSAKLSDNSFISRAPAEIVEKEKARISSTKEKILLIERNIESLSRQ